MLIDTQLKRINETLDKYDEKIKKLTEDEWRIKYNQQLLVHNMNQSSAISENFVNSNNHRNFSSIPNNPDNDALFEFFRHNFTNKKHRSLVDRIEGVLKSPLKENNLKVLEKNAVFKRYCQSLFELYLFETHSDADNVRCKLKEIAPFVVKNLK